MLKKGMHLWRFRLTALLLAVLMLFTTFGFVSNLFSVVLAQTKPYILSNGEKLSDITIRENDRYLFHAVGEEEYTGYCWQIADPQNAERFIDISGSNSSSLWVTYALVGSMLDESGGTYLRCQLEKDGETVYTDPVRLSVSFNVIGYTSQNAAAVQNAPGLLAAADNSENLGTYTIVINYLFDDNTIAAEPYGAVIGKGDSFHTVVPTPKVVGFSPFRRVGEDYLPAETVEIDVARMESNITINVVYEPALVDFAAHHYLQNLMDDEYTIDRDLTTKGQALTGSKVGDNLALTEEQLVGFKPLEYERLEVAADGSTVIEIYYNRNYYFVDFDMNGGYGTEPIYTRYGMTVGANVPTRHGYVFDGWELVSYDGSTPSADEKAAFALAQGTTITVPAANLKYRAKWISQETEYTLVFWKENADDDGYSYWGFLKQNAMSGETVDGEDLIRNVSGIDDEQYFDFNEQKTEKNILVEGDGSTVVNVYYTRKFYTITFKANAKCTIPVGHAHGDACYENICGLGHTHTDACGGELTCNIELHEAHTDACIACGKEQHKHGGVGCVCQLEEHTHTVACWGTAIGNTADRPNRAPTDPEDGYIYRSGWYSYIYVKGSWYRFSGGYVSTGSIVDPSCDLEEHTHGTDCPCDEVEHEHTDACYKDALHTHNENCYTYHCDEVEHTHVAACQRLICGTPVGHTHNTNCTSASRESTVKTVYRKYQQSIEDLWPVSVPENNMIYDDGQRWSPGSDSAYYDAVLVYLSKMPPDDFTLTLDEASYSPYTMNYYQQVLPGDDYDKQYNGKNYALHNTIVAKYNYVTREEDFFDIKGFVQYASSPSFGSNGQISISGSNRTVNFYYDRIKDKYVTFNNNGITAAQYTGIMYGASLKEYNFEPEYPDNLEPNAYAFAGWYTSPGCFKGTEVDWETLTMPEDGLMLYAKWAPITHTVRVYKDANLDEQIGETQVVEHKAFAKAPIEKVENGNYVFLGWFYTDIVNGEQVEKAFVFTGIPITEDMQIYAKWSSHVSVNYTIHYVLKDTGEKIAEPTYGTTIAGNNKTFSAKAGNDLYAAYREGYYPITSSHTVTMSVEGDYEYYFEYVFAEAMPYKVQYLDAVTGNPLCEDKVVMDNNLAVVTETFARLDKKMPDAYQKRLVLSASGTNPDENGIFSENVITFYYNTDEKHAYYRTVHYIENIAGDSYREYRSEDIVGNIGETYTVQALNLTGFAFEGDKTTVNGVITPVEGSAVSAKLGADGLLIELYYDRAEVEYMVRYLEVGTDKEIVPSKESRGLFGAQIVEYAPDLSAYGYELVVNAPSVKTMTLSANKEHNIIEFFYQEKNVTLKYQIVGPTGCGNLAPYAEPITAVNGSPQGTLPTVNEGFAFVGWYTDAACSKPVDATWVDAATNRLIPKKAGAAWKDTTYYAKFIALQTDLTIRVNSTHVSDTDQAYVFRLVGKAGTPTAAVDLTVTVIGNDAATVTGLPTGEYTLTELTDWSWRYENAQAERALDLEYNNGSNIVTFQNTRPHNKYLDGNAVKINNY